MNDEEVSDSIVDTIGEGIEVALPGDTIRRRHICTRAGNRRRIVVLVVGDAEFDGYAIGLDDHTLQILELPSGEVSSIALQYIVSISDGKPFSKLTREERDIVDRRTASFRKTSQTWLVKNWPDVYDRRDDEDGTFQNRQRFNRRPPYVAARYGGAQPPPSVAEEVSTDADS